MIVVAMACKLRCFHPGGSHLANSVRLRSCFVSFHSSVELLEIDEVRDFVGRFAGTACVLLCTVHFTI